MVFQNDPNKKLNVSANCEPVPDVCFSHVLDRKTTYREIFMLRMIPTIASPKVAFLLIPRMCGYPLGPKIPLENACLRSPNLATPTLSETLGKLPLPHP